MLDPWQPELDPKQQSAVETIRAETRSEPHTAFRAEAAREEVRLALLELPREQRLCLILREYEGLSHRETAEILGCSEGAVRVLAFRARRALARRLKALLEEEKCHVG